MQIFHDMIDAAKAATAPRDAPVLAGNSVAANTLRQLTKLAATSETPVLLTGPQGAGKRAVALAIHSASVVADMPFVETSGERLQIENFAARWDGTLFVTGIARTPVELQYELLDWLATQHVRTAQIIVAAEHWPQPDRIVEPLRRVFERLRIPCPALAQRRDDIPVMLQRLWAVDRDHIPPIVERDGWAELCRHDWSGNFDALQLFAQKSSRLFGGRSLTVEQIRQLLGSGIALGPNCQPFSLKAHLAQEEKMFLIEALLRSNGVVAAAAGLAGLNRTTFLAKMRKHGLARV